MTLRAASPQVPPPTYQGNLVESLLESTDRVIAEGRAAVQPGPAVTLKPQPRNYFRLTELPAGVDEIRCVTADCENPARLLLDSRDSGAQPHCPKCAYVEFALWMVGV